MARLTERERAEQHGPDDETSGLPGPAMAAALALGLVALAAVASGVLFKLFQWGVQ